MELLSGSSKVKSSALLNKNCLKTKCIAKFDSLKGVREFNLSCPIQRKNDNCVNNNCVNNMHSKYWSQNKPG